MASRVYLPISTAEYARLSGVSTRAARRRITAMPGVTKIGARWQAPILASEYAKLKGIRLESARKRKAAVRATSPEDAGQQFKNKLYDKAYNKVVSFASKRPRFNPATIDDRLQHASSTQLSKIARMNEAQWELAIAATLQGLTNEWVGTDDYCIFFYH